MCDVAVVLAVVMALLAAQAVDPVASQTTTEQPATAVWPVAAQSVRFEDPTAAALSFAVEYLGFVDPVVGPFVPGDAASGEVDLRPLGDGPVTTVQLRRLPPDDSWWVLGATTPNLQLTAPAALEAVASPVTLSGQSTAFEANVMVAIRQDGIVEPLTTSFFTGGSMGVLGPFSTVVAFDASGGSAGAIVLTTSSMEDGRLWEATVVRVAFAAVTPAPGAVAVVPALTG